MMSGSSLETSIDIWGETATDLLKIDESEKTRDVIQQNTDTIHKILGKKFSEVGVHFASLSQLWTYIYWSYELKSHSNKKNLVDMKYVCCTVGGSIGCAAQSTVMFYLVSR